MSTNGATTSDAAAPRECDGCSDSPSVAHNDTHNDAHPAQDGAAISTPAAILESSTQCETASKKRRTSAGDDKGGIASWNMATPSPRKKARAGEVPRIRTGLRSQTVQADDGSESCEDGLAPDQSDPARERLDGSMARVEDAHVRLLWSRLHDLDSLKAKVSALADAIARADSLRMEIEAGVDEDLRLTTHIAETCLAGRPEVHYRASFSDFFSSLILRMANVCPGATIRPSTQ